MSLRLASCGDRGVPAGTCFENEVRQIDACFRPASLMATAPTNSSDSWEVRHVPGVDDASVPCPLISRCEEHSAHICCRHAFLSPSSLLPPFTGVCLLFRTDFFEGPGERALRCAPPTHDADKLIQRHRAPVIADQSNRKQLHAASGDIYSASICPSAGSHCRSACRSG